MEGTKTYEFKSQSKKLELCSASNYANKSDMLAWSKNSS